METRIRQGTEADSQDRQYNPTESIAAMGARLLRDIWVTVPKDILLAITITIIAYSVASNV